MNLFVFVNKNSLFFPIKRIKSISFFYQYKYEQDRCRDVLAEAIETFAEGIAILIRKTREHAINSMKYGSLYQFYYL